MSKFNKKGKASDLEDVSDIIPWEVDQDPDQHIIDPNQPWDKLIVYPSKEEDLVNEISHIATLLEGKITKSSTTDTDGKESKKIIIEYDLQ